MILMPIVYVKDMDASLAFYESLGFEVEMSSPMWSRLRAGDGAALALHGEVDGNAGHIELAMNADDLQPLIVQALPRHSGQVGVAGEEHAAVELGQRLAEGKVVLVDEEGRGHRRLCRQRTQLLLVGDGGRYLLRGHLVSSTDVLDGLTGVEQLPEPLGGHALDRGAAEADERINDDRRRQPSRVQPPYIAVAGWIELDLLEEPLGVLRQQDLLTRPDHDGDR